MREKTEKALADLKKQREGLLAQLGQVNAAIGVVEYLLKEDKPAEPQPATPAA